MPPTWSVLLPTHNRADVVGLAIKSVLAQSDGDFELLVVGDGCTDDTASVVGSFEDPRIRWFDLPKAPSFGYANRNTALKQANGRFIAFMAHDDLFFPDHLERMRLTIHQDGVEWAYSRPVWMDDDGIAVPFAVDLRRPDAFDRFMLETNLIPAPCIVHTRECLEKYGYWPETLAVAADWELWKRIVGPSNGANIAYHPEPTCIHFRADWKKGWHWGPPPLSTWQEAAHRDWWPADLKVSIPAEEKPQSHIWRQLSADPSGFVARWRSAVVSVIDGFAVEATMNLTAIADALQAAAGGLIDAGNAHAALFVADRGLLVTPETPQLYAVRARALMAIGKLDEALRSVTHAVELNPKLPGPFLVRSQVLAQRGSIGPAIEDAATGISLAADQPDLHAQLARLLMRSGDLEGADEAAREAAGLAPDQPGFERLLDEIGRARRNEPDQL